LTAKARAELQWCPADYVCSVGTKAGAPFSYAAL
jgi:hypothetical protein